MMGELGKDWLRGVGVTVPRDISVVLRPFPQHLCRVFFFFFFSSVCERFHRLRCVAHVWEAVAGTSS